MPVSYTVIIVVLILCLTFLRLFKMSAQGYQPPKGLRDYVDAKCDELHHDESSCVPLWDGKGYFCPYRPQHPTNKSLSDW